MYTHVCGTVYDTSGIQSVWNWRQAGRQLKFWGIKSKGKLTGGAVQVRREIVPDKVDR